MPERRIVSPDEVVDLTSPGWNSRIGRYFIGQTEVLNMGNHLDAWGGIINPHHSGVNLYFDIFTITNFGTQSFTAEIWLNQVPPYKATKASQVTPSNQSISPPPKPKVIMEQADYMGEALSEGANIFNRIVTPNSTLVSDSHQGSIIIGPGGTFSILLKSPGREMVTATIVLTWWEEKPEGDSVMSSINKPNVKQPQKLIVLKDSVYHSFLGKYYLGQTEIISYGGNLQAWGGLINPLDSKVNMFLNAYTISNYSSQPITAEGWLSSKLPGKAETSIHFAAGNQSIAPPMQPKVKIKSANFVSETPKGGTYTFVRRVEPCITLTKHDFQGMYIIPPGSSFALFLLPPGETLIHVGIAFGWWEEEIYEPTCF